MTANSVEQLTSKHFCQKSIHLPLQICRVLASILILILITNATQARTELTYTQLMRGNYTAYVDFSAFLPDPAPDVRIMAPKNTFEGILDLQGGIGGFGVSPISVSSDIPTPTDLTSAVKSLFKDFRYEFVQDGGDIIPVQRGVITTTHPWWDIILEPGKVWNEENDGDYTRAAIPFSLKLKNDDCTHNGVLMFLFKDDGSTSSTDFQIASETCPYLKFNVEGVIKTAYRPAKVSDKGATIIRTRWETSFRLPVAPISDLKTHYSVDPTKFTLGSAKNNTVYGVVVRHPTKGYINYVGGCDTRYGKYPYCDVLDLPSFSTSTSLFASLAVMMRAATDPSVPNELVTKWLPNPECKTRNWDGVNFSHLLDMATGNYDSIAYLRDETSKKMYDGFFTPTDHASKIKYSCATYPHMNPPGRTWVNHTSDTYILGAAFNNYLKSILGSTDIYSYVFSNLLSPLGLSPTIGTRRTYDSTGADPQQPLTGYGLNFHHDDIARLSNFLNADQGSFRGTQLLSKTMLDAAMQRTIGGLVVPEPIGPPEAVKYKNGFFAREVTKTACYDPEDVLTPRVWVPYTYDKAGIFIAFFPNDVVYYSFSDGLDGMPDWTDLAREVRKIGEYCYPVRN